MICVSAEAVGPAVSALLAVQLSQVTVITESPIICCLKGQYINAARRIGASVFLRTRSGGEEAEGGVRPRVPSRWRTPGTNPSSACEQQINLSFVTISIYLFV